MRLLVCALLVCGGCYQVDAVAQNPAPQSLVDDWRDEIIYQLVTDRFADGDPNNDQSVDRSGLALARYQGGDFQGILEHLDYLEALGVTAIWISPVTRTVEEDAGVAGYHGYWPQDFGRTNPHFGDLAGLRELVGACHQRRIKVILDIVVNHIGQLFYYDINLNGRPDETVIGTGSAGPLGAPGGAPVGHVTEFDPDFDPRGVQAATALGPAGPAPIRWLYEPAIDRMPPQPALFQNPDFYHRKGRIIDYSDRMQVLEGDFPGGLKDLATERRDVRDALVQAYAYWMDAADFDGFRIDTAKHVEPEFFEYFSQKLREHAAARGKRNFFLFGEVFDGDDAFVGSYSQNGRLDSLLYFPHKFRVIDAVFKASGPTREIQRLYQERALHYGAAAAPGGIGLAPRDALVHFLDDHDVPRFRFDQPSAPALENALAYLFTTDGIPCLYYGTEQAFSGGNDPANRERLWSTGFASGGQTFRTIQTLIALRKQHVALRRGDLTIRWVTDHVGTEEDAGVYAFERATAEERVLVALSVSDTQRSHTSLAGAAMPTGFPPGATLRTVYPDQNETVTVDGAGRVVVELPPRVTKVLVRAP